MSDRLIEGMPVIGLLPGSVAERAGVRVGDRVFIANGRRVDSLDAFVEARRVYADRLELTLQRGHEVLERLLVFDRPDDPDGESVS